MGTRGLLAIVVLLSVAGLLAATNPTTPDYDAFLEATVMAQLERRALQPVHAGQPRLAQTLIKSVLESVIHPNTVRRNYGLFSLFETRVLDTKVVVLGIGTAFFPLRGVEEVIHKAERMVPKKNFSPP